jgi:hypothetical protein
LIVYIRIKLQVDLQADKSSEELIRRPKRGGGSEWEPI